MNGKSSREHVEQENNDQISLLELLQSLWRERWSIFITFLITVLLSLLYAFTIKPVYLSEAFLVPVDEVSMQKVKELDLILNRGETFEATMLFQLFKENASSRRFLESFFVRHKLFTLYDPGLKILDSQDFRNVERMQIAFTKFFNSFNFDESQDSGYQYFSIKLALPLSGEKIQKLLNDYVKTVRLETRNEVVEKIRSEIKTRIENNIAQISSKRMIAKDVKSDRVAELNEAIKIAKSLKISEPSEVGAKATIKGVSNQGLPLYYLGYRLLEAEKRALLKRESDDPFIPGLRELQGEINLLKSIKLSGQDFKVVVFDQQASVGQKIKPKKTVILIVAGMFGLLLGVFVALIKAAIAKQRIANSA